MSELRAPDPTLTAYDGLEVAVSDFDADVPVAHRRDLPHGLRGVRVWTWHARWFAVPCRECFPDAPPRGVDPLNRPNAGRYLAWQVQP